MPLHTHLPPAALFCLLLMFTQCKPVGVSNTVEQPLPDTPQDIVWTNSDWQVINIFDETAKREYNISAAPYLIHLNDQQQWQIKLDKNKCNSTFSLSENGEEMTVLAMGCTRICCDGDAGKALSAAMATDQVFRVENATSRTGWVLLKSPKLTLRLRPLPDSAQNRTIKPSPKVPQTLVGTWFAVYSQQDGKTLYKYPAGKHALTLYDEQVSIRLDVNSCNNTATFTDSQIICPDNQNMGCTKACCDEVKGLTIFVGTLSYKFKDNFLVITTAQGYQLWLQR